MNASLIALVVVFTATLAALLWVVRLAERSTDASGSDGVEVVMAWRWRGLIIGITMLSLVELGAIFLLVAFAFADRLATALPW